MTIAIGTYKTQLENEQATISFGALLAKITRQVAKNGLIVFLNGDLGAGKTTLTRGFVQAMGHKGNVKSPTYTIVEPYELPDYHIFHFDLYRLADPEELEYMGIRDYFGENTCCFIEWPEKAAGLLANEDLIINIAYEGEQRIIEVVAASETGKLFVAVLNCNNVEN